MRKTLAGLVLTGGLFLGSTVMSPSPADASVCLDNECLHTYGPYSSWGSADNARNYYRRQLELQQQIVVWDAVSRIGSAHYAAQISVIPNIQN